MHNGYKAEVTVYDENDKPVATETAYGNTTRACDAAAGALRRHLENVYGDGSNGIIGPTVRA